MLRMRWIAGLTCALAIVLAVAGAGCSDSAGAGDGERVSVADEGGVETIEVVDLWASDWPDLPGIAIDTFVSPSGGDEIGLVAPLHAAFLPDGGLVIGDVGTRRVWRRTAQGDWAETAGPGQGPGEFRGVGGVWVRETGIVVYDPVTSDLVHFDGDGQYSARHPVSMQGGTSGAARAQGPWPSTLQWLGGDDWLLAAPGPPEPAGQPGVLGSEIRFLRISGNPAQGEEEVGAGSARPVFVEGGGGAPIPFASTAMAAGAGGLVALFEGDRPEVELFGPEGTPRTRVRWNDVPEPLGEAHRAALGDFMRRVAPAELDAAQLDAMIGTLTDRMPLPEAIPHLGDLKLGQDGALWLGWPGRSGLELPTEPEHIGRWRVVVPDGEGPEDRVYRVDLPTGTTLLGPVADPSATGGAFLLLLRDDLGRQGIGILRTPAGSDPTTRDANLRPAARDMRRDGRALPGPPPNVRRPASPDPRAMTYVGLHEPGCG